MKTEGIYSYFCVNCETLFAVVSRFMVKSDLLSDAICPRCGKTATLIGEGYITHEYYETKPIEQDGPQENSEPETSDDWPTVMNVKHVAAIMGVSPRVAYLIMDESDFPLIRVRRSKKVNREDFFQWLENRRVDRT